MNMHNGHVLSDMMMDDTEGNQLPMLIDIYIDIDSFSLIIN